MKKLLLSVLLVTSLVGYSQDSLETNILPDTLAIDSVAIDTIPSVKITLIVKDTLVPIVVDTLMVDTVFDNMDMPDIDNQGIIDPQRPTITESNTLVSKGRLQFENGYDVNITDSTDVLGTFIRYGVTDNIEIRMATNYVSKDVNLGVKFKLFDFEDINLGTAFTVDYNTGSGSFYKVAGTIGITESIYSTYNLCYQDNSDFYHVILLGYSNNKCGAFVEYTDADNTNRLHGGATYRILNNVQVDLNGGYFTELESAYIGVGVSFFVK
jgi:hypothetical protein|tara:strand:- start:1117 stop:1920 length:804 start_codon:yes stop_codon:yes gene_type:complete